MNTITLLADPSAIKLTYIRSAADSITIVVKTILPRSSCPLCGRHSTFVHSRYVRRIADLPWQGVLVKLELHTRRFRCDNDLCPRRIFCERLPQVVATYACKTVRLNDALRLIGFLIGGEAGARAAVRLGMSASPDTLIRRGRQTVMPAMPTPRVLGLGDWAKRKGQSYGTILVALERRCPVDLLPDREAGTLAAWLKAHPGVEVVTRDRARAYAEGITGGAPHALQVADRFHILKNLSEALERVLTRHITSCVQPFSLPRRLHHPRLSHSRKPSCRRLHNRLSCRPYVRVPASPSAGITPWHCITRSSVSRFKDYPLKR
jgi:transposase